MSLIVTSFSNNESARLTTLLPLDGTHHDAVRGLIQTKRFRPSASTNVAATTVRSRDLFNIMSSLESVLIRQD